MFPLNDSSGKVVAFSGRILSKDVEAPKYVNSPETELYKKSELLYGYDKAKHGIRNLDFSLIVEGQFDVVMSHQAGYTNAVAVSGTALTLHHVQLLERLSRRVVLALDADRAGIAAMKRAADLMLRRGLDVKVAEMPEGKDPADIIRLGKEQFKAVIGKSVHVIEFLLHVLTRTETDSRALKLKAREEILPFILLLPNRIDQEHFVDIIGKGIGTTSDAIRFELERLRDESKHAKAPSNVVDSLKNEKPVKEKSDALKNIRLFLEASVSISPPHISSFLSQELQEILNGEHESLPESEVAGVTFHLEQQFASAPKLAMEEEIISRLNTFKTGIIRQRLNGARQLLLQLDEKGDAEVLTSILETIKIHESKLKEPAYSVDAFGEKTKKAS
jgi:DNA primase